VFLRRDHAVTDCHCASLAVVLCLCVQEIQDLAFVRLIRHQPVPYEASCTIFHHLGSLSVRSFGK
jgi:hypothetical protein